MPILDAHSLDFTSHGHEQTLRYGVRIGEELKGGDVLCLSGELGSGKTTLAIGIGRGWGALETVTSPSFTLAHEYNRADNTQLHHLDCYRLSGESDLDSIGLTERLEAGAALIIEWPENIEPWLPQDHLWISMRYIKYEKRSVHLIAKGKRLETLLESFRKKAFARSAT
jgi:tRNA threonylcarbamoyladenosine biosynthesis protein TsaE